MKETRLKRKGAITLLVIITFSLTVNLTLKVLAQPNSNQWIHVCTDPYGDQQGNKNWDDLYYNQYFYFDGSTLYFRMDVAGDILNPQRCYSVFLDTRPGGDPNKNNADFCLNYWKSGNERYWALYNYSNGTWEWVEPVNGSVITDPAPDDGDGTHGPPGSWVWWGFNVSDLGDITNDPVTIRYEIRSALPTNSTVWDTQVFTIPRNSIPETPPLIFIPFLLILVYTVIQVRREKLKGGT